jgi:hypothetical protein
MGRRNKKQNNKKQNIKTVPTIVIKNTDHVKNDTEILAESNDVKVSENLQLVIGHKESEKFQILENYITNLPTIPETTLPAPDYVRTCTIF